MKYSITTKYAALISVLLSVAILVVIGFMYQPAQAQFNQQINYQGKLTDSSGVTVADGTYHMRFWLLTSASIATTSAIWTEDRSTAAGDRITVTNGLFSVMLGSSTSLSGINFNQTLYLGVEVGGSGGSAVWDGEMSPRKILGAVPAAFESQQLGGVASTSLVRSDEADTIAATESSALLTINQSGSGNILDLLDAGSTVFTVVDGGRVGISSSSPSERLVVADGNIHVGGFITSTSTATSTFSGGIDVARLDVSGQFFDTNAEAGTNGEILQSTASGVDWVATSSLGLGNGTFLGLNDTISSYNANRVLYTDASSVIDSASLTFDGTILTAPVFSASSGTGTSTFAGGLTVDSTDFVVDPDGGRVSVGNAAPSGRLTVSSASIGSSWQLIGSPTAVSTVGEAALAALSPNRVAFIDSASDDLRLYEFNGSAWSLVGSELSITGNDRPALAALSPNRVAFIDSANEDLRVYEFNGSAWSLVGNELNISGTGNPGLTALSSNRVAFIETVSDNLTVYEFDGASWNQVGNSLNIPGSGTPALAALSPNRIAIVDGNNDNLRVYEFNNNSWTQLGTSTLISNVADPALAALSPNRVAFFDETNDDLRVYEFDGSTWGLVGTELNITTGFPANPALAALSPNRVAFIDGGGDELRVYQFSEPLFYVGDSEDYPYFGVSDVGHAFAESLDVRTELTIGSGATTTGGASSTALTVDGLAYIGGFGTSTVEDNLEVLGTLQIGTSTVYINGTGFSGTNDFNFDLGSSNFGIGTSTPSSILAVGNTNGIEFTTGTSTFYSTGGIDLLGGGCFAIGGTCVGGGATTLDGLTDTNVSGAASGTVLVYDAGLSAWDDVATSSLGIDLADTTGSLADARVDNDITVSGGTIGSNSISGTLTTTGTLTIGDGGDRIDISSNTWDVTNGVITSATWQGSTIGIAYGGTGVTGTPTDGQLLIGDGAGYTLNTITGGTGITITNGIGSITAAFDCSEVEGTGINCSGENITLDATGDWTGTFDGQEGTHYLDLSNHTGILAIVNGGTGTSTFSGGAVVFASSTGALTQDISNFVWDDTNNRLGISTTSPWQTLAVDGDISITGAYYDSNNTAGSNGQVLQTTGSGATWVATSSLNIDTTLSESAVEGFIFDADNSGTISSGTFALDSLSYTGTLDDTNVNDAITISGGTIGSNSISGTLTTTGTLTIGDGGDRVDISSDTWDVTNGVITNATWNGAAIDFSTYTNATAGDGIAFSDDDIQFSCTEVEGAGINCSSNDITLDATGDWTGTLDGVEGANFLRSNTSDAFTSGTLTINGGTTLDVNGELSIADTTILLDGASTDFTATGDVTFNTNDLVIDQSSGNIGISSTSPSERLTVADGNIHVGGTITATGTNPSSFIGDLGIGTSSPITKLAVRGDAGSTRSIFTVASSTNEIALIVSAESHLGIGTTTPNRRLHVLETVSDDQFRISYDSTRYADFQVDSSGDLFIDAQGNDVEFSNENVYICAGGACPTGAPSGTGNLVVEENITVGTTTVRESVTVNDSIYVANGWPSALGEATSTFRGDILITGKLDVGTIDPVYNIDGTKYATFGHSMIGVKEEVVAAMEVTEVNEESGYYEKRITFSELEVGSDLWLFYQITEFGTNWGQLIVNLTPSFDGIVFYEKLPEQNALLIKSTDAGEISARFVASRFDFDRWPNLRPDQDNGFAHFELEEKNK